MSSGMRNLGGVVVESPRTGDHPPACPGCGGDERVVVFDGPPTVRWFESGRLGCVVGLALLEVEDLSEPDDWMPIDLVSGELHEVNHCPTCDMVTLAPLCSSSAARLPKVVRTIPPGSQVDVVSM